MQGKSKHNIITIRTFIKQQLYLPLSSLQLLSLYIILLFIVLFARKVSNAIIRGIWQVHMTVVCEMKFLLPSTLPWQSFSQIEHRLLPSDSFLKPHFQRSYQIDK